MGSRALTLAVTTVLFFAGCDVQVRSNTSRSDGELPGPGESLSSYRYSCWGDRPGFSAAEMDAEPPRHHHPNCSFSAYLKNGSITHWAFDPDHYPVDPGASTLHLRVTEQDCTSGRRLSQDELTPHVFYGEKWIEILIEAPELRGPQTCPGNPINDYVLELEEPVGQRKIVDAGRFPLKEPPVGREY